MSNAATQSGRFAVFVAATIIVLAASSGGARADGARADGDGAASRISLTKAPALQIGGMERNAFLWTNARDTATTRTCLQTGGRHIPYRVSASSLSEGGEFSTKSGRHAGRIGYSLTWSDAGTDHALSRSDESTPVMGAESGGGCEDHTLSIELDHASYDAAAAGTYVDTLSLFFVIE